MNWYESYDNGKARGSFRDKWQVLEADITQCAGSAVASSARVVFTRIIRIDIKPAETPLENGQNICTNKMFTVFSFYDAAVLNNCPHFL